MDPGPPIFPIFFKCFRWLGLFLFTTVLYTGRKNAGDDLATVDGSWTRI